MDSFDKQQCETEISVEDCAEVLNIHPMKSQAFNSLIRPREFLSHEISGWFSN
jgi:hypothetical protein